MITSVTLILGAAMMPNVPLYRKPINAPRRLSRRRSQLSFASPLSQCLRLLGSRCGAGRKRHCPAGPGPATRGTRTSHTMHVPQSRSIELARMGAALAMSSV
jgi:hypothetical protein